MARKLRRGARWVAGPETLRRTEFVWSSFERRKSEEEGKDERGLQMV